MEGQGVVEGGEVGVPEEVVGVQGEVEGELSPVLLQRGVLDGK